MENSAGVCYPKPFSYLVFIGWAAFIGAIFMPIFYVNFSQGNVAAVKSLNFVMLFAMPAGWLFFYWLMARNYRRTTPGRIPGVWHFIWLGVVQLALLLIVAWFVSIGADGIFKSLTAANA